MATSSSVPLRATQRFVEFAGADFEHLNSVCREADNSLEDLKPVACEGFLRDFVEFERQHFGGFQVRTLDLPIANHRGREGQRHRR